MRDRLVDIGAEGVRWLTMSCTSGLSTARLVAELLSTATVRAFVVAGEASHERLLQLESGGLPRSEAFSMLSGELIRRFQGACLIVELSLARPSDAWLASARFDVMVCGEEVYAAVSLDTDGGLVEEVLRATDPASVYNAFVLDGPGVPLATCPREQLEAGNVVVRAVVTGAYDGEGFVVGIVE